MSLLVLIIGGIGTITLLATMIGISRADVRSVRLEKDFRRHPYARRFKQRPLVSILIDGEPTDECIKSIRRGNYRKIEIITTQKQIRGTLLLTIASNTILGRASISHAVRQITSNPSIQSVELLPVLTSPQTIREFFHFYYRVASAPFITARAGLAVSLPRSSWPVLANLEASSLTFQTRSYLIFRWLAATANLSTLIYVCYIAVMLYQPAYLLMYLATFGAWMLWAISRLSQIHIRDKLLYLILTPASLIYFAFRSLLTPLRVPFNAIIDI